MVSVRPIAGKKLLGTAGHHSVVTDRKAADGGSDAGCTSGELLLIAIASCATGSIRNALAARGLPHEDIRVEADFVSPKENGARDGILITIFLPQPVLDCGTAPIVEAATVGGVVSRLAQSSDIDVCCRALETKPS
jgi:hypothetical protein